MSLDKATLDQLRIDRTAGPPEKSRAPWVIAVLLLGVIVAAVIWWLNRPKAVTVRTMVVQAPASGGSGERTLLNASGYVTARRQSTVSAKVTGKIVEVLVEEGMKVELGQILARLDVSNAERSLALAEAQLESTTKALDETRANLETADREFKRVAELSANKITSQSELDRVGAEARALRARLARQQADITVAQREVALWTQQMEDTIIRAPFAGVVTSKDAQPGEMISPMSAGGFTRTGICTIVDMSSLEIEVDVNESYINRVRAGQPVEATLDSYPEWQIPAKVIAIIPTADRQKATVKVRVGFEKLDPRILPDMSVKAAFLESGATNAAARTIEIPKSALQQRDNRDIVWLVRDGRVERRAVTVGARSQDQVSIAAGVAPGDRVVLEPPATMTEGMRVTEANK